MNIKKLNEKLNILLHESEWDKNKGEFLVRSYALNNDGSINSRNITDEQFVEYEDAYETFKKWETKYDDRAVVLLHMPLNSTNAYSDEFESNLVDLDDNYFEYMKWSDNWPEGALNSQFMGCFYK